MNGNVTVQLIESGMSWPVVATFILAFVTLVMACGTLLMAIETRRYRILYHKYIERTRSSGRPY